MKGVTWNIIAISILFHFVLATNVTDIETTPAQIKPQAKRQASALATIEKCKRDREICLEGCKTIKNCTETCPVCAKVERIPPIIKPGVEIVNRNIVVEGVNGQSEQYNIQHPLNTNHTTIFRLQNFINNTNVIKMPTFVNSSNINNINIFNNDTESSTGDDNGPFGYGVDETGSPCCIAIQPKTCRFTPSGPRCQHRRHKTCGSQCTSRIVHIQNRNRCRGRSCSRGVSYIPQPQPRCFYTNSWPFVACGGQRQRDCSGCYDHYEYSYRSSYSDCGGCYDDGFAYGQLYRRGPVLRPYYYQEPPCYITGLCSYESGYNSGSYGYYGESSVDPVSGPGNIINDDDEDVVEENNKDTNGTDWGVVINKCKTVSENGTVKIEDCKKSREHPYALSPINTNGPLYPPAIMPQPFTPYYGGYAPVIFPPVYNPAIDYDYYARQQPSGYPSRNKVDTRRNKRKTRLLRRRSQGTTVAPKEES